MTYYDWISYFDNLKNAPINDKAINFINSSDVSYKGNIKIRFQNHIIDLINYRLNNSLDNFLLKIKIISQDNNTFIIEINELKKEIEFAKNLAQVKFFDENDKQNVLYNISEFVNEMTNSIKLSFENVENSEMLMIINNLDLENKNGL